MIPEKLFKVMALKLTGYWYQIEGNQTIIFSLLPSPLEKAEVKIIKEYKEESLYYQLYYISSQFVIIILSDEKLVRWIFQVVNSDTLVLQIGFDIQVFERQVNLTFADKLLEDALR